MTPRKGKSLKLLPSATEQDQVHGGQVPSSNVHVVLLEGFQMQRGALAAACCRRAFPSAEIIAFTCGTVYAQIRGVRTVSRSAFEDLNRAWEHELSSASGALVVPCSLKGMLIANRYSDIHRVLGEGSIRRWTDLDKTRLFARQNALKRVLPKISVSPRVGSVPLLAKPRYGHTSQGQIVLRKAEDTDDLCGSESYYFEPLIEGPFREYSFTVVKGPDHPRFMTVERLRQHAGVTVKASRHIQREVEAFERLLLERLVFKRIMNIQFAWTPQGARIYDINPRFGHSELYRTCFGFNCVAAFCGKDMAPLTSKTVLKEREAWAILNRGLTS